MDEVPDIDNLKKNEKVTISYQLLESNPIILSQLQEMINIVKNTHQTDDHVVPSKGGKTRRKNKRKPKRKNKRKTRR